MQEGIGRGGYRVLAVVFFAVVGLGLVMAAFALEPSGFFEWLGLALAAIGLVALCGMALAVLAGAGAARAARNPVPEPAGAPLADDALPPATENPAVDLGVEYGDFEAVGTGERGPAASPTGPPRIQPPPVPIVQPRRVVDAKGWPDVKPSGVTRRQVAERSESLPRDPGPMIEVEGPAAPRREPPIVMARTVASAEATGIPEGSGVGKCGNCGVLLLAPKKRPIRLQCPRCERVHTLA